MLQDTLAAQEAEGTSAQQETASAQAAPETADQPDVARYKQEAEVARQEARFQALARKVDVDEFQFRDVFAADRKAAARIAKEKWDITPEEVLAQLSAAERSKSSPDSPAVANTAEDMDAWYARKQELESARKAKEEAMASLQLSPEDAEKVEREFGFLANGRRLDAAATRRLVIAAYNAAKADDVQSVQSAQRAVSTIVTSGRSSMDAAPAQDPLQSEIKGWKAQREQSFHKNWYAKKA